MKRSCWSKSFWTRAWCGVLGLALLSGCSSPQQVTVDQGTHPNPMQDPFESHRDLPPSAKTLYSMADILATQGKDTECEFVLRRCVSRYPHFTPAYNRLAELQMRQGRVHEAVVVLGQALEVRPRDPVLLNNLGMCLLVQKEYARALDQFIKAAGIVPESEKYRANMATCLGLLGRYRESLALMQQVLPNDMARQNAEILRKACKKQADTTGNTSGRTGLSLPKDTTTRPNRSS